MGLSGFEGGVTVAPVSADRSRALDGNAAAGVLADLFGREMTEARLTCGGCHGVAIVGTLVVYAHGMGTVVRCRACDHALLRVARVRGGYHLDASGCAGTDDPALGAAGFVPYRRADAGMA